MEQSLFNPCYGWPQHMLKKSVTYQNFAFLASGFHVMLVIVQMGTKRTKQHFGKLSGLTSNSQIQLPFFPIAPPECSELHRLDSDSVYLLKPEVIPIRRRYYPEVQVRNARHRGWY